jgi:bifunctional DNase/RNase
VWSAFAWSSRRTSQVLLLRESNGDRYLPIWIGQSEAAAIALEQQVSSPPAR